MRTDDCARQIEYVTHTTWTHEEYKKVCSVLRLYRYKSILSILGRAAKEDAEKKEPKSE